ncbi:MAG: outer membrane beta-barrel protein [Hyphomonadaceae bacterium]|nr:outer membrane beta-barrel protein [Hyphomonadaceae bacterium]
MDSVKRAIGLAALAAGLAPVGFAQQGAPEQVAQTQTPAPAEGVQTFEAAYFRQYNPVTAADIVNRVPGFDIDDGEVLRGFGATAGNVLVNGERPSSKVLISEQLKRIPADSVIKVELISGSASNVDVRGQTQLVNVVLKQAKQAGGSPTTWVADLRDIQYSERIGWQFQLTKTFALGDNAELTVDLQTPNLRGRVESFEAVRNSSGALTSYREVFGQPNNIGLLGSGVLKWRPTARDTVSFNAQVAPTWNTQNIGSVSRTPAGTFVQGTFGKSDYNDNYTAEVGGDWEHRFSPALSMKVIGLLTETGVDQDDVFRIFTPTGAGPGGLANVQTINRTTQGGERVARGFLTWRPSAAHTIDVGLEGAFNFRDTTLDVSNNNGTGPVPQFIAVANAKVEEERAEPFITDVWKISSQLTLETGFIYEASRITQTGDAPKEREFSYPKPRMIATWQAGATDQLRASIIRDVSQLDFAQFASAINVVDAFSTRGNPDLEPEKAWKLRGEWERRFGKRGAITLAVFHDDVEDVQDLTVIGTDDAFGNIGPGKRTGVEVRGAAPLSPLIPNAEIRFSGMWQETEVTDPSTGEKRRFANENEWSYNLSFRQELPSWKAAWGASAQRLSDRLEFKRAEEIVYDRPGDRIDLFLETTQIKGITLRFSAGNIFHPEEFRERAFYQGSLLNPAAPPRSTGLVLRTEERKQKGGPEGTQVFSIRASGTF